MTTHPEISADVLGWLQELGTTPPPTDTADLLAKLRRFDWINRLNWKTWDPTIAHLSEGEMTALAKGLVRAEQDNRWLGGSVAAAIWVYRDIARRFPEASDALAEWMLQHSDNPWVPFGSNRGSARSLAEYRADQSRRVLRNRETEEEERTTQYLRVAREDVHARLHREEQVIQHATAEARRKLLEELAALPIGKRLEHVAWDDRHEILYYPPELFDVDSNTLRELHPATLRQVLAKASAREHGPWRKWAERCGKLIKEE